MIVKLLIIVLVVVGRISYSTSDDIVKRLEKRYNNVKKCGKNKPAYECNGIMIRGVNNQLQLKYPWDMKPKNKEREAFSLAYLRKDQPFSSIHGCDSGFIIYPHMKTPKGKNSYKLYCAFPMNGATDYRKGRHGCGTFHGKRTSQHCDKLKITSYDKWKSYYKKIRRHSMSAHCAFDLTLKSRAKVFDIALGANKYIQKHSRRHAFNHNELRMHAWNAKKPKNIPIEAFYYVRHSKTGKGLAEKFQDQFYSRGGGAVPIVEIRLPTKRKSFKVKYHKRKPHKIK